MGVRVTDFGDQAHTYDDADKWVLNENTLDVIDSLDSEDGRIVATFQHRVWARVEAFDEEE